MFHNLKNVRRQDQPGGVLPDGGALPTYTQRAHALWHFAYTPLNGRAFTPCVSPTINARACVRFRTRARRYDSVRRLNTVVNAYAVPFEVLLQVKWPRLENVHALVYAGSCSPVVEHEARLVLSARSGLYGFMKCKRECTSTIVCVSYLRFNYSNCPVSWRKPVGVAEVRTLNSCHMVRKDTN